MAIWLGSAITVQSQKRFDHRAIYTITGIAFGDLVEQGHA